MKNKNFLKKLTAGILGFVMTLGVGAAGYAGAASESRAVVGAEVTIGNGKYQSVYETGFENASTGTNYQGTVDYGSTATDGASWTVYYGTVSTSSKITGNNSMHLRLYKDGNCGYAQMTSNIADVSAFKFNYAVSNKNVKFDVLYSSNNGSTWTKIQSVSPSGTTKTEFSYEFGNAVSNFRLKVLVTGGHPSSSNYTFRIDDIVLGKSQELPPEADTYTVKFAGGGATGSKDNVAVDITQDYVIPDSTGFNAPTGKSFDYWSGTGGPYYVNDKILAGTFGKDVEVLLTAVWKDLPTKPTDLTEIAIASPNAFVKESGSSATGDPFAYKGGTSSSKAFSYTVSGVPKGANKLVIYAASWKGDGSTTASISESYSDDAEKTLIEDAGLTSNTPFTLTKMSIWDDSYRVEYDLKNITSATNITISFTKRACVWYSGYSMGIVHAVTISGGASSIYAGGTTTFSASCDQQGCTGITWESSDSTVASISDNGKVIGLKAGTTTISATCAEGGSDSKTLTVTANALSLSPSVITDAQKGGSYSITASLSGVSGQTVSYVWSSDQPSVVSVTGNTATASLSYVNGGTATITCIATVNGVEFSNTCSVTVVTKDPVVSFDNPTQEGWTGISYDFTAVSANIDNGTWSWKVNGQDFTFDDELDENGYSVRYATFSVAGSYTMTATCTGDGDATATATTTIVITASSSVLTIDPETVVLQKGTSVSVTPTLVVTGSYVDSTDITVTPGSGVTVDKTKTTSGNAVEVTAGTRGGATKVTFSANGQDVECSISIPSSTTDKITSSDLEATGTTYVDFTGVKKNTAVYAGNSQYSNGDIGFRSNNSNSGIVSTTSGGIISKVIVTWHNTTNGRQLDVYGKNEAYEDATDLYSSSTATQGDSLGSLVYTSATDNNTEITINGSYQYVGVRSKSGATTIADISFVWVDPVSVESVTAGQDSISVAKGASSQLIWTVLPSDASNKAVEFSMSPELTGVTVNEDGLVEVTKDATVGATSTITIASKENSSIKDTVSLTVLDTYLDNTKVLGRTGFTKFTTEQTFVSVRGSENYIEAKYIDGSTKTSKGDNASMWSNTKCYVNNGTEDSPNWVEYNMSSAITNADNGKQFKFVYTETVNNQTYTQTSNPFTISVDNVTIKSAITLYYSNSDSYAHSHDFTKDAEYSATGTVTWSVVNEYDKASITQSGVLTIDGAPTNVGASMQFIVRAVCGACTRECTVTLRCEPATSVSVDWPDTIAHEASGTFTATVETKYARQAVCWTSDNEALTITPQSNKLRASWSTSHLESDVDVNVTAFVDEDGDETYTEGEAIERKTITIHAAEIPVTEVNITDEDIEIWQDDDDAVNKAQFTLHATVTEGASVQKALWSIVEGSDNVIQSSGSIYEGLSKSWKFTGNAGTATIRATSMNKENEQVYDELTVTVKQSVLTDISVDASASTVVKEFEKDHVITASDYEGLVVNATYQSGNSRAVTPTSVTCDTSKVGASSVIVTYTLNGVTKQDSYGVTIHAPSGLVIYTPVAGEETKNDANITAGSKLLNNNATISDITINDPGYVVTKLDFEGDYNKSYNPAVEVTLKIGGNVVGTQNVGTDNEFTLTFNNTNSYTGQIVLSFVNKTGSGTGHGTFYWNKVYLYKAGADSYVPNTNISDNLYAFVDEYGETLSVNNWSSVFASDEYKALSSDDKALLKNGVASGTDKDGTKTSSEIFANFFNAYDAIAKQYGPEYNTDYLNRDVEYNKYNVSINGVTVATDQVAGTSYTLPTKVSDKVAVSYTIDGETYDPGETIKLHENVAATAELITDVATISVSTEANFSYSLDNKGLFSEITKTTLRMYIELDADTYNYYVSQGYDFSIALSNSSSGKTSKIASSQMSVEYDEEKGVYVFNVALNIPSTAQYETSLGISLVATKSGEEDVSTKSVSVSYKAAAQALYASYQAGTVELTDNQVAALKAILGIN